MLSNSYFLAKFRFDTAENEPAKMFAKFANFANPNPNPPFLRRNLHQPPRRGRLRRIQPEHVPARALAAAPRDRDRRQADREPAG